MQERLKNLFHTSGFKSLDRQSSHTLDHSVSPCETLDSVTVKSLQLVPSKSPQKGGNSPLRQVAADVKPVNMSLTIPPIMQEQLDLRLASAENPTVVMELDMDCNLTYVSKSWEQLVGTSVEKILNKPILNILLGSTDADLTVFHAAVAQMIANNALYKVKFLTATNDVDGHLESSTVELLDLGRLSALSVVDFGANKAHVESAHEGDFQSTETSSTSSKVSNNGDVIELEAQGIVIFSPQTHLPTHLIWTVRPFVHIDLDLTIPDALVDLLGFGAEIFEGFLVSLRESGIIDETSVPEPKLFLCRICETNFPAWFIEKHTDLCLLEHKVEEEVQFCHDAIAEQRDLVLRLSELLWFQQFEPSRSRPSTPNSPTSSTASLSSLSSSNSTHILEYKGIPLPVMTGAEAGSTLRLCSSLTKLLLSFLSFRQSRKFPFGLLQKLVDYCDEALLINAAEKLEKTGRFVFSPNTETAMKLVMNWQALETSDLAIRAMVEDTRLLVTEKVDKMARLLSILQYSEKIKQEVDEAVLKSVTEIVAKIKEKTWLHENSTVPQRPYFLRDHRSSERPTQAQTLPGIQVQAQAQAQSHSKHDSWEHPARRMTPLPLLNVSLLDRGVSSHCSLPPSPPPVRRSQGIYSPQPSRVRSPNSRILGDQFQVPVDLNRPMPSLTLRDLLGATPGSFDSRGSLSPNTSLLKPATQQEQESGEKEAREKEDEQRLDREFMQSVDGLNISLKSPENASPSLHSMHSFHSTISSPRFHLSPAPYVEKPGYSALQRNTTATHKLDLLSRPVSGDYSMSLAPNMSKGDASSPLIVLFSASGGGPPLASLGQPDAPPEATTVPPLPSISSLPQSAGHSNSLSSPRPPLSPLLVSQQSNQRATTAGIKDYELLKAISKGAFGSVFLAKRKLTGDYVAIKCLKKGDMIAKNQVLNVRAERAVMMKQTDSSYVAQLHCSFQTKDYLYLVMEYLNGGDCATLLKMLGTLGDKWAKRYIAEAIVGVEDLHRRNIIHRDLKPDNLLIDSQGHLKLTDFGLSRIGFVGRHTNHHRKSSVSEHGIELFHKSAALAQSPLANSTAVVESPELPPNSHKRNLSMTPFSLSPATDQQHKFVFGAHTHLPSVSSSVSSSTHDSASANTANNVAMAGGKKRSLSHFRMPTNPTNVATNMSANTSTSINRSGSASSSVDSPNLRPVGLRSPSETSFALLDDDCEFLVTPGQVEEPIHTFALFDPNQESENTKKFVGTPDYLAPETITGERQGEYSDWWSIGCILFEFLYGYPPFHASTPEQVFQRILTGDIDWPALSPEEDVEFCSPKARDLIVKLLALDPEQRLGFHGAEEIMQHPYFAEIHWATLYLEMPDSFIPALDGPDSTDYFDLRGADLSHFPKDDPEYAGSEPLPKQHKADLNSDSGGSPGAYFSTPSTPTPGKREIRGSRLADASEFGSFNFRNLNVLEKANKDVINRLKSEHLEHRSSFSSSSSELFTPGHSKSRGLSISSNIVNLGSPFKRLVSPAPAAPITPLGPPPGTTTTTTASTTTTPASTSTGSSMVGPLSPGMDKLPLRGNRKTWDIPATTTATSASASTNNSSSGRSRALVPSLSRQILLRTAIEPPPALSPYSSDNEEYSSALYRVQHRRDSLRRLNSSASGSSLGTQSTRSPQKDMDTEEEGNIGALSSDLDVLYCEPSPIVRRTVSRLMEKQGCIVLPISDGEDLIRRATSKVKFDLIFTALRLTKIEAVDAVKLIKYTSGVNSSTPIIAITGFSKEATDLGIFDDVLEKPVDALMIQALMAKFHFLTVAVESEPDD